MTLRQTHTFAELELSPAAYDEIAEKIREAGYAGVKFVEGPGGPIDMHGIGVTRGEEEPHFEPADLEEAVAASYASGAAEYIARLEAALELAPEHDAANDDRYALGRLIAKAKQFEAENVARLRRRGR